jgi:hypothetical protein
MIKKLMNVFGIFFDFVAKKLNFSASYRKANKQKNELCLKKEKAHLFIL